MEFEDYLTDASFVDAFRATYRGRHDPADALFWLRNPIEPGPSGADAPAAGLAALKRAAYSRGADPLAEQVLGSLERELAADRDETLAAIVRARNPRPIELPPEELVFSEVDVAPARRRPWLIVAAAVAAVAVALVGIRLVIPAGSPDADQARGGTATAPAGSSVATNTFAAYTPTPRPTDGGGAATTCANLVDVDTLNMFGNMGLTDVSDRITMATAPQTVTQTARFGAGGSGTEIYCAWSDSTENLLEDHIKALYAYSEIDDRTAASIAGDLENQGFSKSTTGTVTRYVNGDDDYAFGDGFWAYSLAGDIDVLDEVVAHTPEMADEPRADLQKAVYVTSEGIGDLRIGEPIPSSSRLAAWDPSACFDGSGAWLARSPFAVRSDGYGTVVGLVTKDRERTGVLNRILIYSPKIPTKSGIRVGDSEKKLTATFDAFADGGPYELTGTKGKIRFEVGSVDPQHPENTVVLAILVVPVGDDFPPLNTDANGPCPA